MSGSIYKTARWQKLRKAKLSCDPLCEVCIRMELIEPATVVDHIIAINKGGEPFPPLDRLMSMCKPCHDAKTNAVDHPNASGFRRAWKGFDVDGNPIDPTGWDAPDGTLWGSQTTSEAGAFAGRRSMAAGPAGKSSKDLVSCESFATGNRRAK